MIIEHEGYTLETTREGRRVRCICRDPRGGTATVTIDFGPSEDPDRIATERIEVLALSCCRQRELIMDLARYGKLRKPRAEYYRDR
jgi:hypothetical protein